MSDQSCQNCGVVAELENGLCSNCRLLEPGAGGTIKRETSSSDLQNPRMISPDDLVRRVAGGLKEPNSESFQETFTSFEGSDQTPVPVPSTVETVRRERPESVAGKYTMVEKVGTGGAGDVWKAWDESIHRWVALKFLKNEKEINLQRFRREARMVGRLSHPHIIPIHEMGILGEHHYIAMKFVEGATLQEYVRQDARLIAGLIRDAAEALQYAHENDVIHRDIKPTNILVEEHGSTRTTDTPSRTSRLGHHIYVADFGLAKQVSIDSSLSISGNMIGTPSYMSPEQANGKSERIDARTDIYSLGVSLYELLSGQLPFRGETIYDVLKMIVEVEPAPLRKHHPQIDPDLETIVMKCLRKEPENRYRTAGNLAEDLDCYLQQEPLKYARPLTFGYRMRKRIQKQPLLWSVTAAFFLSILFGSGFGIYSLVSRARVEREGREKANMAALRAKALMDARRAIQWGEGKKKLVGILKKAEAETNPDAVWLSEAGRLLYETNDKEMKAEAKRFLEKATKLDKGRAFEALYYLHLIEDEGKNTHDSRYLQEIRTRAESLGETNNPFVLIMRCDEAIEAGDYDLALGLSDRAVKNGGNIFDTWNHRGMAKVEKGDFEGAIEDHTRAIELNPKYAIAWNQRGLAKFENGDSDGAIVDYNRAIELDPDFYAPWNNRGLVRIDTGNPDGAIADYSRAIEIYPTYVHAWNNRGNARMDKRDFDGAIEDCSRAIEIDPEYVRAWNNRGNARMKKGDFDGAIVDYNRAIELHPKYVKAFHNRGLVRVNMEDYDGAIEDYTRAIEIDPEYVKAWYSRGLVRNFTGDPDGAIKDYSRAIEIDPTHLDAWSNRGYARNGNGDLDGAIEDYSRVIELDPKYLVAWYNRGLARMNKGDLDGAIEDYSRAIEIDPTYLDAWSNRGYARNGKGDFDGAIKDYSRAIELDPKYVHAWNQRGIAKSGKGDFDGAIADYTRAIELDPKYVDAWNNRGISKRRKGNFDGAIEDYTRAIEIDPEYVKAWYNRGLVRKFTRDPDGAIKDYSRVIEIDPKNTKAWYSRGISKRRKGDFDGAISDWEQLLKISPKHPKAPAIRAEIKKLRARLQKQKEK